MRKKVFIMGSMITICSLGFYLYDLKISHTNEDNLSSKVNIVSTKELMSNSKVVPVLSKEKQHFTVDEDLEEKVLKEGEYIDELMFLSSPEAEDVLKASGKLRENLEGEVYLNINAKELLALNIGDTFRLDIPELDIFYDIEVNDTFEDQFGNKTIKALVPDQDMIYSSVFTINERAIYANVSTPDGIYVMQGNGQYAWMAETNDLSRDVIMDSIENNSTDNPHDYEHEHQEVLKPMASGMNKERIEIQ
ncbi:hypothetical protein [uncultured Shewanella sp.]|uniref:hypothetical protein n=1 Tax=uncultured Shewanella sp. TaxID=173975 RepID=UPI0026147E3F|nr:hypothetical protein [uncultured Shewanella sp.]